MSRQKSILIGVLIVIVGILLFMALIAGKPSPPKKPLQDTSPLVEVLSIQSEALTFEVETHGLIAPRTETTLVSEVAGTVESISSNFVVGGYFKKGEVLLKIEATDYQVSVEQARARLASQKAKYLQEQAKAEQASKEWDLTGRAREDAPVLALRKPFLLEAKANMESAEADLKKALQKLARTEIRAPYDGMVKSKQADVGQFVATGSQLGAIFATDYAEVRLPLTDQELAFINVPAWGPQNQEENSHVRIVASYAGQQHSWHAELVRMEGVVNQQSRVHYAVARVVDPYSISADNPMDIPLKVGTFVTAHILGKQEQSLIKIPRSVFKDLNSVLVSDKQNQLYSRLLQVARSQGDYVYVRSGLRDGDRIILTSIPSPVEGMALRIAGEPQLKTSQKDKAADKVGSSDEQ
jgi:RND family efflux transporter MFP subunit